MFDILFGWRKASKCQKLIRHVRCRLKLLKIKRESSVRQLRDEIAHLLQTGHNEAAFSRVEQLFKDHNLMVAYDLLGHFCEFIIIHFSYIRKHKDCPNDINEAVSTLIYAAAWCGDLPELKKIQKLFGERYGCKFAEAAVELNHGTLVNCQIREKLCLMPISDSVKLRLMDEIAKDYSLQHQPEVCLCQNREELIVKPLQVAASAKTASKTCDSNKHSSQVSFQFHEDFVKFKEVEEYEFSRRQDVRDEDKRTFLFNSFTFQLGGDYGYRFYGEEGILLLSGNGYGDETGSWSNKWTCSTKCKFEQRRSSFCRCRRFSGDMDLNCSLEHPCYCRLNLSSSVGSSAQMEPGVGTERLNDSAAFAHSCSEFQVNGSHVHPKLPDYDELVAKFRALKEQHQRRVAIASEI